MKHSPSLLGIIFILTLTAVVPAFAQNSAGTLVVMTYNVNEGTDFLQVLSATTPFSSCWVWVKSWIRCKGRILLNVCERWHRKFCSLSPPSCPCRRWTSGIKERLIR